VPGPGTRAGRNFWLRILEVGENTDAQLLRFFPRGYWPRAEVPCISYAPGGGLFEVK
jgi:hypothetical protein